MRLCDGLKFCAPVVKRPRRPLRLVERILRVSTVRRQITNTARLQPVKKQHADAPAVPVDVLVLIVPFLGRTLGLYDFAMNRVG